MRASVAIANLVLGTAYTGYGVITFTEMKRGWKTMGFSHFGAAWIAMAFTCGPHHLFHGIHVAFEGRMGGPIDLFAVVIGLPFGVAWLLLRLEALAGGRGDRHIAGTPWWLALSPAFAGAYVTALGAAVIAAGGVGSRLPSMVIPNLVLIVVYFMIGYFLMRTQTRNREPLGGWSLSGLSLTVVFPTCALMHGVWAFYGATGRYHFDIHGFVIDWLSIPAALYFLWVVRSLYRDTLRDWNQEMGSPAPREVLAA